MGCHTLAHLIPVSPTPPSASQVQPRTPSVHTRTASTYSYGYGTHFLAQLSRKPSPPPGARKAHASLSRVHHGTPSEHTRTDTVPPTHPLTRATYLAPAGCGRNSSSRWSPPTLHPCADKCSLHRTTTLTHSHALHNAKLGQRAHPTRNNSTRHDQKRHPNRPPQHTTTAQPPATATPTTNKHIVTHRHGNVQWDGHTLCCAPLSGVCNA